MSWSRWTRSRTWMLRFRSAVLRKPSKLPAKPFCAREFPHHRCGAGICGANERSHGGVRPRHRRTGEHRYQKRHQHVSWKAFEYLRNSVLDAADFFTNKNHGTKNPLHRNQYGGTVGGPILKNKMFFFGSYEGFRQVDPTLSLSRVPSAAEIATVTDPISKSLLQFWPAV